MGLSISSLDDVSVRSYIVIFVDFYSYSNCFDDAIKAEFFGDYLKEHEPQHLFDYFFN